MKKKPKSFAEFKYKRNQGDEKCDVFAPSMTKSENEIF